MTTTTILILNGVLAAGLLAALALVMAKAHRVAGSGSAKPLELEFAEPVQPELDRAA